MAKAAFGGEAGHVVQVGQIVGGGHRRDDDFVASARMQARGFDVGENPPMPARPTPQPCIALRRIHGVEAEDQIANRRCDAIEVPDQIVPDRGQGDRVESMLGQGIQKLGEFRVARGFPAGDHEMVAATSDARQKSVEVLASQDRRPQSVVGRARAVATVRAAKLASVRQVVDRHQWVPAGRAPATSWWRTRSS